MYRIRRDIKRGFRRDIGRKIGSPFVLRYVRITESSDTRTTEIDNTRVTEKSADG